MIGNLIQTALKKLLLIAPTRWKFRGFWPPRISRWNTMSLVPCCSIMVSWICCIAFRQLFRRNLWNDTTDLECHQCSASNTIGMNSCHCMKRSRKENQLSPPDYIQIMCLPPSPLGYSRRIRVLQVICKKTAKLPLFHVLLKLCLHLCL